MKIIKYKKLKNNLYELTLDNNKVIKLYDNVILNNQLLITKEIINIDELLNENKYEECYFDAIKYLSKKMHTKIQLEKYLLKSYDNNIVLNVLDKILNEGYLNDNNYIESYIHDQVYLKNYGYNKIYDDLLKEKFNESDIKNHLYLIDDNLWKDKIKNYINKKIKINNKYGFKYLKEKITNELYLLGYDKEMILDVFESIDKPKDNIILEKTYYTLLKKYEKTYEGKVLESKIINKLLSKGFLIDDIKSVMKGY